MNDVELDAARYRWLRKQHWTDNTIGVVQHPKDKCSLGTYIPSSRNLDELIDSEILKENTSATTNS